jgi:hypothetical protein
MGRVRAHPPIKEIQAMNREDVKKLSLGEGKLHDLLTGKPRNFPVIGLPLHLTAEIDGTDQSGYRYCLTRGSEVYKPNQPSRSPEAAFHALKKLLNWDSA